MNKDTSKKIEELDKLADFAQEEWNRTYTDYHEYSIFCEFMRSFFENYREKLSNDR